MKYTTAPLQQGVYYHIYNRGNNRQDIFLETRNYAYFLKLYATYIAPIADTYAYCLLKNHFHLMVRIRSEAEWQEQILPTVQYLNRSSLMGGGRLEFPCVFDP